MKQLKLSKDIRVGDTPLGWEGMHVGEISEKYGYGMYPDVPVVGFGRQWIKQELYKVVPNNEQGVQESDTRDDDSSNVAD